MESPACPGDRPVAHFTLYFDDRHTLVRDPCTTRFGTSPRNDLRCRPVRMARAEPPAPTHARPRRSPGRSQLDRDRPLRVQPALAHRVLAVLRRTPVPDIDVAEQRRRT